MKLTIEICFLHSNKDECFRKGRHSSRHTSGLLPLLPAFYSAITRQDLGLGGLASRGCPVGDMSQTTKSIVH